MFNKQNFCHIASNNRNDVKAGVFVYKTTDNLATVSVSGYFNEKIVDINLHDLIIHEWHDPTDRTNVEYNLLCVTERTLDNVATQVIKTAWAKSIDQAIADIEAEIEALDNIYVKKTGDTMSGPLKFDDGLGPTQGGITGYTHGVLFFASDWDRESPSINLIARLTEDDGFVPYGGGLDLGASNSKWDVLYVESINNGYNIAVPVTNSADTLALKSEVDLAANSGDQLTAKGVWYAKMYAATVPPAADNGTNYADFSQVDGNGDPIIVIYERQSGAWVQTQTITPPANYNGYVTVTSKIWDIPEQSGQQGGKVLWSHNQKTFTPYPQIISFEDAALTGNSTVAMPLNPTNDNIANKGYVDSAIASALPAATTWDLFDFKWKDCTMSRAGWALSDGNWINKADAGTAYQHLVDEYQPEATAIVIYDSINQVSATFTRDSTQDMTIGDHSFSAWENSGMTIYTRDANMTLVYVYTGGTMAQDASLSITDIVYNTQTETIAGTTITYYLAVDGHKICLPDQETNIDAIYAATGVAWYYILDNVNQRFKLPRENPSKELIIASKARIAVTENGHVPGYTTWVPTISASTPADGTDQRALYQQPNAGYSNLTNTKYADGTTASPDFVFNDTIADIDTARTGYAGKQYLYFYIGQ